MKRKVISIALALSMFPYFAFAGSDGPVELDTRIDPWDMQENITESYDNNNESNESSTPSGKKDLFSIFGGITNKKKNKKIKKNDDSLNETKGPTSDNKDYGNDDYYNPDFANMTPDGGGIYDTTDPDDNPFETPTKPKKKKPNDKNTSNTVDSNDYTTDSGNFENTENPGDMYNFNNQENPNSSSSSPEFDYNFDYKIEDNSGLSDSHSGIFDMSLSSGGNSNVSSDELIDYGFGLSPDTKAERPKKISFQFVLNKNKPTEQVIDTGIDSTTTDRRDLTELLRQISVLTKSEYVQDEKEVLLLSNGKVKTCNISNEALIDKEIPFSDVLSYFNSGDFAVKENLTRVGEKFLMVDSFEKNKNIKVFVDGKEIKLTTPVKEENGIVFLPIRDIASAMGATVKWNDKTYEAHISKDNKSILYKGSSDIAIKTQEKKTFKYHLEEKAEITKEKRLLAGISILVKTFGYDMYWDSWTQSLKIESEKYKKEMERLEALESVQRSNENFVETDNIEEKKTTTPTEQPQNTTSEKTPDNTSNNPTEKTNKVENATSNQDKVENGSGEGSEEHDLDEEIKKPEKKKPSKKDRKKKDEKRGKTREKKKGIFSFRFGRKK